jgi:hypothetical protein
MHQPGHLQKKEAVVFPETIFLNVADAEIYRVFRRFSMAAS